MTNAHEKAAMHRRRWRLIDGRMRTRTPQADAALRALLSGCQPDPMATRIWLDARHPPGAAQKKGLDKRLAEAAKATIFYGRLSASAAIAGNAIAATTGRMFTSIADWLVVAGVRELRHAFARRLRRRNKVRCTDNSAAKNESGRSPDHKQATGDVRQPHDLTFLFVGL